MYQPSDATALSELYVRSVLHFGPRAYTQDQVSAWAATSCAEKIASRCMDGRLVLVALDDLGRHLGFGDLEEDGHLDFLYSAPEAEGLRVGSTIYEALERHARNWRIARIYVEASELAKPLLEKRGFVVLGRNDLKLGNVDIYNFRMEKWL
jgi:putative acetyltransferase